MLIVLAFSMICVTFINNSFWYSVVLTNNFYISFRLYRTWMSGKFEEGPQHRIQNKDGSRHKNLCMTRVLGFLIRYFSNYYTLHHSDLAARAAPLDPRLQNLYKSRLFIHYLWWYYSWDSCAERNVFKNSCL